MVLAACDGMPEAWFFPKNNAFHHAAMVCASCPVKEECKEYALHHRITYGMWGGTTPGERREMVDGET